MPVHVRLVAGRFCRTAQLGGELSVQSGRPRGGTCVLPRWATRCAYEFSVILQLLSRHRIEHGISGRRVLLRCGRMTDLRGTRTGFYVPLGLTKVITERPRIVGVRRESSSAGTGNPLTFRDRRAIAVTASGQILMAADMRALTSTLTHSCRRRIRHLRGRARCSCQPVESKLADADFP